MSKGPLDKPATIRGRMVEKSESTMVLFDLKRGKNVLSGMLEGGRRAANIGTSIRKGEKGWGDIGCLGKDSSKVKAF